MNRQALCRHSLDSGFIPYSYSDVVPTFQFPKVRQLPKSRHPIAASSRLFSIACIWRMDCISTCVNGGKGPMQSIATITDDLENREISAA
jgi:hypothetical protein